MKKMEAETKADYLRETLGLAEQLIGLADRGCQGSQDHGCFVLLGVVRDCGYKIRECALEELRAHLAGGPTT